jgi:hypothetical protein
VCGWRLKTQWEENVGSALVDQGVGLAEDQLDVAVVIRANKIGGQAGVAQLPVKAAAGPIRRLPAHG